jgi:hypothetical protein
MFDSINFTGFVDNMPDVYKTKKDFYTDKYHLGSIKIFKNTSNNKIKGAGSLSGYFNGGVNYPIISVSQAIEATNLICDLLQVEPSKLKLNWFDVTLDLVTPHSYIDIHNIYLDQKVKAEYFRAAPEKGNLLSSYFKIDKDTSVKIYDLKYKNIDVSGVRIETTCNNSFIKTFADITAENAILLKNKLQAKVYDNLRYKPPELAINESQNNYSNLNTFKRSIILQRLAQFSEYEFSLVCSNLAANGVHRSSINKLISDRNEALKKINLVVPVDISELISKQNYKND